jgi:drug/metabolite transporter (DMT)-like permease
MFTDRRSRTALPALIAAGLLWGTSVPLSKLSLQWLAPGWLTFARFGLAAAVLLVVARGRLRAAVTPAVLGYGALGYGGSVIVQNIGITRTSVTHAALLIGATPVLVALIAAVWQRQVARPLAWAGFALSLVGVGLVTGGRAAGASPVGDILVLVSVLLSAAATVRQTGLLRGRDPIAVTGVQFLAAALAVLPVAVATEGTPAAPTGPGAVLAAVGLAIGGTLLPFTLFAYAQARVSAEVAGAFLNLEPLVGAVAGVVFFGNPVGLQQLTGGAAILAGIVLGGLPLLGRRRPARSPMPRRARPAPPATAVAGRVPGRNPGCAGLAAPLPVPRPREDRPPPQPRRAGERFGAVGNSVNVTLLSMFQQLCNIHAIEPGGRAAIMNRQRCLSC